MSALVYLSEFLAAALVVAALNHIGLRRFRRADDGHWTERARLLYPARVAARTSVFFLPVIVVALRHIWLPAIGTSILLEFLASWCGVLIGTWFFDRSTITWLTWRMWWQEVAMVWGISLFRFAAYIAAISAIAPPFDWSDALVAAAVILFELFLIFGGLVRIFRRLGWIPDAPSRVQAIVEDVATRLNVPMPEVWAAPGSSANAVALIWMRAVFFTNILIDRLTDSELRGVAAHEVAHLNETRFMRLLRLSSMLAIWPWLFIRPLGAMFGFEAIIALGVWWWLVRFSSVKIANRLELRADRTAVDMNDEEKAAYASALAKLYEINLMPAVMPGNQYVHPHLYDRMLAAGVTPDFPRPRPAAKYSVIAILVNAALVVTGLLGLGPVIGSLLLSLGMR